MRIVSRRHPVRCSGRPRAHAIPFRSRRGVLSRHGSSACVLRVAPCHLRERAREHDLSIGAINQIKEPVAVRLHDQVLVALIDHDGHLGGVVVMLIMLGELKIPFELSRVWIQRQQRIAVEIVARASFPAIRRRRIAGGPKSSVGSGIVSPRDPRWRPSDFPGFAFPRFMSRLARTRDRVEAPFALAGRGIIRVNEAANSIFPARHTDEHEILDHQRRERDAVAIAIVHRRSVPHHASGLGVQRDNMRIQRAKKNFVSQNGHPAIHAPATRPNIRRQRALILPDRPARPRVERKCAIVLARGIEDAVHNQRCRFEFPARHRLISPLGNEHRCVRRVDLVERAEPVSRVVAGVHQPVLRLLPRIQQPLRRHLRASVGGQAAQT